MKKIFLLALTFGLLLSPNFAETIVLGDGKSAHLTLPDTWLPDSTMPNSPEIAAMGTTVRYVTKNGSNDAILVSFLPVPDERFSDLDNLKAIAEQGAAHLALGSVEGKAHFQEINIGGRTGLMVTFTDASLVGKPSRKDDYKALTSCFVYLGRQVMVTATIFTDDVKTPAYAQALRTLKSLSLQTPKEAI